MQRIFLEVEHAGPPQDPFRQVRRPPPHGGAVERVTEAARPGGVLRVAEDGLGQGNGRWPGRLFPFLRQHERQVHAPVRGLDQPRRGNELRDPVAHRVFSSSVT